MKKSNLMKSLLVIITSSIFFSCFLPIAYSDEVGIFDGMEVKHTYTLSQMPGTEIPMIFTFSKLSDDMFHIENELKAPIYDTGSWDVNISTRVISNVKKFGPDEGDHAVFWIYTDVSLNDQFLMCNLWKGQLSPPGDTLFNVTGEAMHGSMAVWILEDAYGSELWYEKTKGFFVNGTISYAPEWNHYEFVETNALRTSGAAIPGYSYLFLISIIIAVSIIILKKQKIKK
ncbi:MAG: hypothetical protein ACFFBV_09285 [Promethearchaeota archaeon]